MRNPLRGSILSLPDADDIATAARYEALAKRLRQSWEPIRLLLASLPLAFAFLVWIALVQWVAYQALLEAAQPIIQAGPWA